MALAGHAQGQAPPPVAQPEVFAFVRALDEAAAKNVWPGFNPTEWPIALFDGEQTVLLRHPSPPSEFAPMPGRPGVLVAPGRFPAVVSNSTREIGGVRTATVIAAAGQNVESTMLAIVEEVFHVFWLARHPSFRPNEMARYAYPVKDAENLRRILAEDEALARALEADAGPDAARWAATSLGIRRDRTAGLADAVRAFETALEMMEGSANYTARRSLGQSPGQTAVRLRAGRPAESIRWRFYDTGTALCFLLDRFDAGWKVRSDSEPELTSVELLSTALARRGVEPNTFTETETAGFQTRASGDVADLAARQQRLRGEVLARPGARVIVEVAEGAEPLEARRFDPINLFVLDAGEVVQANFITLAGSSGTVEMTNPGFARNSFAGTVGLTVSAGSHPLGDRIRRVTIVGVQDTPQVASDGGALTVVAQGVRIELRGASVHTDGETTRITVPAPPPSLPPAPSPR
jgi:hypothetical protein